MPLFGILRGIPLVTSCHQLLMTILRKYSKFSKNWDTLNNYYTVSPLYNDICYNSKICNNCDIC